MLLGALAQSIPDIDFIAAAWTNTAENLLAHRGFTHSILFDLMISIAFALLADHYHKAHRIGYKKWIVFFLVQVSVHLFIDLFNSYGVGLLEPFSHKRFSFNAMFVADPLFSIWPVLGFIFLLVLRSHLRIRKLIWKWAVIPPLFYLASCFLAKELIDSDTRKILADKNITYNSFISTPTPLNNLLWYIAVKADSGFYIGYRSVFDSKMDIELTFFKQNENLLKPVGADEELQKLLRFSRGYFTVENWNDSLVFNDLRFGQITGWHNPKEKFVFHYFLGRSGSNTLVVQRGRFANWNKETFQALINRISGE
jgi:inner membrane protein